MPNWYDQYESQCWYTNTFLVNHPRQIARARNEYREWNNINECGCNFVCIAMMLGINPAYLASLLAAQKFFRIDKLCPATPIFNSQTSKGLVWDETRPYPVGEKLAIRRFWHPNRGRGSCVVTLVDIQRAANERAASRIIKAARRKGLHVICGYDDHSHLIAGQSRGKYFIWDPVSDERHWHFRLTAEDNVAGRYSLERFFRVRSTQKEFRGEQPQFWLYRLEWRRAKRRAA